VLLLQIVVQLSFHRREVICDPWEVEDEAMRSAEAVIWYQYVL
jgi:hypothetical protein